MLFTPEEPTTVTGNDLGFKLHLVVIGAAGYREAAVGGGVYCVEIDHGRVVLLDNGEVVHVNASPAAFLACLQEFAAGLPYGTVDSELEELDRQAQRLAAALTAIDDSALLDDWGEVFWLDVVNEVRVGEYTANR